MPPEMARRACVCGPPCDVFSSGVTFFFMLQVCARTLCVFVLCLTIRYSSSFVIRHSSFAVRQFSIVTSLTCRIRIF
jgi:hypothetical protein